MSLKPEPESLDDIAEANIQAALREQAGKLDLIGLGLTSPPESLGKLTSLQSLDLSGNQLTACRSGWAAHQPAIALPLRQSTHEPAGVAGQAHQPASARP